MKGFISHARSTSSLAELWQSRHLISQLVLRDFSVRYRQTWLGWLWALLNPLLQLGMYYGVFGIIVRFNPPEYNVPYAWVLLSGLALWMLFANTANAVGEVLLNNLELVKKIYFPRIGLTLAGMGISVIDFLLLLFWVCVLLPLCGVRFPVVHLPLLLLCGVMVALLGWGLGCLMALAQLRFRDFRHIIPLMIQGLFYLTPVVWTPGLLPKNLYHLMALNPLYGLVGLFRFALLGGQPPSAFSISISVGLTLFVAVVGYGCFIRYESQVMDRE
ncbi:Polysialic acid transport protein kpsM [Cedecea davisae]|uniref:Transport permease protein n=1 Tax=Cedecea davisae DSM 4568 TaxID=566551 RepID=S3IZ12_9ENTR|nr:ABC transporter permease [Cedecea davisae]EPF17736.1 ABC-2 type transporter [Cedecea davisae DSM 4568]SUX28041.1 Polysialic acid transport protein kpsM [Cedecea davisae]